MEIRESKGRSQEMGASPRGTHPVPAVSIRAVLSCPWAVWPGEEDELAPPVLLCTQLLKTDQGTPALPVQQSGPLLCVGDQGTPPSLCSSQSSPP